MNFFGIPDFIQDPRRFLLEIFPGGNRDGDLYEGRSLQWLSL